MGFLVLLAWKNGGCLKERNRTTNARWVHCRNFRREKPLKRLPPPTISREMTGTQPAVKRSRSWSGRVKKVLLWGTLVGCALWIAMMTVSILVQRQAGKQELRQAAARWTAAGIPMTYEGVESRYFDSSLRPGDNAAPIYEQAFAFLDLDADSSSLLAALPANKPFPDDAPAREVQAGLEILAKHRPAIGLLREASRLPYVRFDLRFEDGLELMLYHLPPLRDGARLLWLDAYAQAQDGNVLEAERSLSAILRISRHLREDPFFQSAIASFSMADAGISCINRLVGQHAVSPEALARWQEYLRDLEQPGVLARCLETETVMAEWAFRAPVRRSELVLSSVHGVQPEEFSFAYRGSKALLGIAGYFHRDEAYFLDRVGRLIQLSDSPIEERLARSPSDFRLPEDRPPWALLSGIMIPSMDRLTRVEATHIAQVRMMRALLAAERHRLDHGFLPEDLSRLVPAYLNEVPHDPFTSLAIQAEAEDGWFIIRSDGPSGDWTSGEATEIRFGLPIER